MLNWEKGFELVVMLWCVNFEWMDCLCEDWGLVGFKKYFFCNLVVEKRVVMIGVFVVVRGLWCIVLYFVWVYLFGKGGCGVWKWVCEEVLNCWKLGFFWIFGLWWWMIGLKLGCCLWWIWMLIVYVDDDLWFVFGYFFCLLVVVGFIYIMFLVKFFFGWWNLKEYNIWMFLSWFGMLCCVDRLIGLIFVLNSVLFFILF